MWLWFMIQSNVKTIFLLFLSLALSHSHSFFSSFFSFFLKMRTHLHIIHICVYILQPFRSISFDQSTSNRRLKTWITLLNIGHNVRLHSLVYQIQVRASKVHIVNRMWCKNIKYSFLINQFNDVVLWPIQEI